MVYISRRFKRRNMMSFFIISDKLPSEASFKGTEYLKVDLSKDDPIFSMEESVSLQFKTRQHNGLLFYSGKH